MLSQDGNAVHARSTDRYSFAHQCVEKLQTAKGLRQDNT